MSEISTIVSQPDALTQAVANAYVQHTLQVGQANSTALPPVSATAGAPPSTITTDAPTQVSQISAAASTVNRILTWLTANPPGVWPQNTPTRWV